MESCKVKNKWETGWVGFPWQKFTFYQKHLNFGIEIREEERGFLRIFVFCSWHLPNHCMLRAEMCEEEEWEWLKLDR